MTVLHNAGDQTRKPATNKYNIVINWQSNNNYRIKLNQANHIEVYLLEDQHTVNT